MEMRLKIVEAFAEHDFRLKRLIGMVCIMELVRFLLVLLPAQRKYGSRPFVNYSRKENELTNKFELSTESPSRLRVSGTHRFLPVNDAYHTELHR